MKLTQRISESHKSGKAKVHELFSNIGIRLNYDPTQQTGDPATEGMITGLRISFHCPAILVRYFRGVFKKFFESQNN